MAIPEKHPAIAEAYRRGLIEQPTAPASEPEPDTGMVEAKYVNDYDNEWTWILPIETASESNARDWRKRSNRTKNARAIVSKAFGPLALIAIRTWYHDYGKPIRLEFVRLGGRKLDLGNVASALKATEDAVAIMLGTDDGDPRWRAEYKQEPGGPKGVRITITLSTGEV